MVILWQQLKMVVSSSPSMSRVISAPHQTRGLPETLEQSTWWCRTWPAKQLCPVPQAARAHPNEPWVEELWTGTAATCSSRRPGTSQRECANGSYLSASKLPNSCQGRGTEKSRGSHPTPRSASATKLCSAEGTTGASLLVTHSV